MSGYKWSSPEQMRAHIGTGWQMAPNTEWVSEEHRMLYESGALTEYHPTAESDTNGYR